MCPATSSEPPWTVRRVLDFAIEDFQRRGLESPRLSAELLVGKATGLTRIQLIIDPHRPLAAEELVTCRELIRRRRGGEPVAYLLGEREFYGHRFQVDRRVLIPRPDTECLVEVALRQARRWEPGTLLDLCTGSGCVAISLALALPEWKVTATDLSRGALAVAHGNADALGAQVTLREGDLFEAVKGQRFDLITANPPYIGAVDFSELDPSIANFEPRAALYGGTDGLDLLRKLITAAPSHLAEGGLLALELGAGQASAVEELLLTAGFHQTFRTRDYGGHERVVAGFWGALRPEITPPLPSPAQEEAEGEAPPPSTTDETAASSDN